MTAICTDLNKHAKLSEAIKLQTRIHRTARTFESHTFEFFGFFFSFRLLSVLRGNSVFSSPPQRPMTSDFEGFSIQDFIHYIYFPILIPEKEPVFSLLNVQC